MSDTPRAHRRPSPRRLFAIAVAAAVVSFVMTLSFGFVVIGNAVSGGTVPFAFLPDGFRQVAPWLPNGAIVSAARDVVYLPAGNLGHPLLVLGIWLAGSLAVLACVDLLHLAAAWTAAPSRTPPRAGTAGRDLRDAGHDTGAAAARTPAGSGSHSGGQRRSRRLKILNRGDYHPGRLS